MEPTDILKALIAIPSVSPMGRDMTGPEIYEGRVSDWLEEFFRELKVEFERFEVAPGRPNVVARVDGSHGAPTVVLDAHQDTVPVEGMVIPPYDPTVREGRIYGRGACDVKGGMAAMLAAFARLAADRPGRRSTVVMSCTCDEEFGQLGIADLIRLWREPQPGRSRILTEAPDMAIVAEPTDLDIVVAHRGATRWKLRTTGVACHSSNPSNGVSAIYRMAKVLDGLEAYAAELQQSPPHPLCGPPTLSVGRIEGGVSVNVVPAECSIEIDRRVIPGEDGEAVIAPIEQYLRDRLDVDFEMLPPWCIGWTLSDDNNGPLADHLLEQVTASVGTRRKVGVPYGTHASRFDEAGIPVVVFGPGSIEQAHTKDEWLELAQLDQASEILYRFLLDPWDPKSRTAAR